MVKSLFQPKIFIVGAGIVGLALAWLAAKRGFRVEVFERSSQAYGASIRNFGLLWPIGQKAGRMRQRALRCAELWQEMAQEAGITLELNGSLHLAYRPDEWQVLEEFIHQNPDEPYQLLSQRELLEKSPGANPQYLLGGLWSSSEMTVDPREALIKIPSYLSEKHGVVFHYEKAVLGLDEGKLYTYQKEWQADYIFVCTGANFRNLYPEVYAQSGLIQSKLQMMRTIPQPQTWHLGPSLCGGLTLTHYEAFADCPSLGKLKKRILEESPHFPKWGIHVLLTQNPKGELVIGDSHEYALEFDPFIKEEINQYILDYLKQIAIFPSWEIQERWIGIYAKLPGHTEFIMQPQSKVTIVNALGGAGMTLSFGLAEEIIAKNF